MYVAAEIMSIPDVGSHLVFKPDRLTGLLVGSLLLLIL